MTPIERRLAALAADVADDEVEPTGEAKASLRYYLMCLRETATIFGIEMQDPYLSTLGDGGLECCWIRRDNHLYLSISPDGELHMLQHIVVRDGKAETVKLIKHADPDILTHVMLWIKQHSEKSSTLQPAESTPDQNGSKTSSLEAGNPP